MAIWQKNTIFSEYRERLPPARQGPGSPAHFTVNHRGQIGKRPPFALAPFLQASSCYARVREKPPKKAQNGAKVIVGPFLLDIILTAGKPPSLFYFT